MKKILSVLLIVVLISCSLVACNTNDPGVTVTKTEKNTVIPNEIKYTIYKSNSSTSTDGSSELDENISKFPVSEENLIVFHNFEQTIDESVPKTKTISFLGEDYQAQYDDTSYCSSEFESIYEDYYETKKEGQVYYKLGIDRTSGEVIFWSKKGPKSSEKNFTYEEALKKSEEILTAIHGEKFLEEYDVGYESEVNENSSSILITYVRMLGEHRTSDMLTVEFDFQGNLITYKATSYGHFAETKSLLTMEYYNAAVDAFTASIPNEYYIIPGNIFYDYLSGKAYVGLSIRESEDSQNYTYFFINMW